MRKRKHLPKKSLVYFRLGSLALALLFFLFWDQNAENEWVASEAPPTFYASQCQDNLRKIFLKAIDESQHSIFLIIYSLSDESIIRALQKASEHVEVTIVHDAKTTDWGFKRLKEPIKKMTRPLSGLMHQKILIVDDQKVWIGSANMTKDSLSLHDNLVVGVHSPALAKRIIQQQDEPRVFDAGGQEMEFWNLPKEGKEGINRLIGLIDGAKKTVKVAMFTFTHPDLTNAVIRAQERGVHTEVVIDQGNARGMCQKTVNSLLEKGIQVKLGGGLGLFHHKFLIIDDQLLVNGSANWTKAAFSRNADCFLIIKDLNEEQQAKLKKLWHVIRATSRKTPSKVILREGQKEDKEIEKFAEAA